MYNKASLFIMVIQAEVRVPQTHGKIRVLQENIHCFCSFPAIPACLTSLSIKLLLKILFGNKF